MICSDNSLLTALQDPLQFAFNISGDHKTITLNNTHRPISPEFLDTEDTHATFPFIILYWVINNMLSVILQYIMLH